MPYGKEIKQKFIPEWAPFYADYNGLNKLLSPFSKIYKTSKIDPSFVNTVNVETLETFDGYFEKYLFSELKKVSQFFKAKIDDCMEKFKVMLVNLAMLKSESPMEPKYNQRKKTLKEAFHLFMKELKFLHDYYRVNHDIFRRVLEKHRKYVNFVYQNPLEDIFFRVMTTTELVHQRTRLTKLTDYVESLYLQQFYKSTDRKDGIAEIKKIHQNSFVTSKELWFFGFFFGFAFALLLVVILMATQDMITLETSHLKNEFPIFRGMALLTFYIWMLAFDVWVWTKYNIDYKLLYGFGPDHHSSFVQIMKRASFFTVAFFIMFLWYLIVISSPDSNLGQFLDSVIPYKWTGLVLWALFFGYLFFPSYRIFNGPGRKYFHWNIVKTFFAICFPITFPMKFFSIQTSSFVTSLKDLSYTICYYSSINQENPDLSTCQNPGNFLVSMFLSLMPNVLMDIIFAKAWVQMKQWCCPPGYFVMSISLAGITSIISYFSAATGSTQIFHAWIGVAIVSSVFSWWIDVRYCFGFFLPGTAPKHRWLRPVLCFPYLWVYYAVLVGNMILRYMWTLTISPNIYHDIIRPQLFTLILGFVEIFRRGIWNIFIVEFFCVLHLGSFKAIPEMQLPYDHLKIKIDEHAAFLFTKEVEGGQVHLDPKEIEKEIMEYNHSRSSLSFIDEDTFKLKQQVNQVAVKETKDRKAFTTNDPEDFDSSPKKTIEPLKSADQHETMLAKQRGMFRLLWLDEDLKFKKEDLQKIIKCPFPIQDWVKEAVGYKHHLQEPPSSPGKRTKSPERGSPTRRRKMTFIKGLDINKEGQTVSVNPQKTIQDSTKLHEKEKRHLKIAHSVELAALTKKEDEPRETVNISIHLPKDESEPLKPSASIDVDSKVPVESPPHKIQ